MKIGQFFRKNRKIKDNKAATKLKKKKLCYSMVNI